MSQQIFLMWRGSNLTHFACDHSWPLLSPPFQTKQTLTSVVFEVTKWNWNILCFVIASFSWKQICQWIFFTARMLLLPSSILGDNFLFCFLLSMIPCFSSLNAFLFVTALGTGWCKPPKWMLSRASTNNLSVCSAWTATFWVLELIANLSHCQFVAVVSFFALENKGFTISAKCCTVNDWFLCSWTPGRTSFPLNPIPSVFSSKIFFTFFVGKLPPPLASSMSINVLVVCERLLEIVQSYEQKVYHSIKVHQNWVFQLVGRHSVDLDSAQWAKLLSSQQWQAFSHLINVF